ncbi:tetratricopeptide repeat protein [Horticoccus luteus]|uniref:Tetratricopeptide repeat protein n=1 Tax=Horticoccus luteus TaxID=2862869 RepID=A0A8F9XL01_9BACT|nr:tetratricopeptide repeat protein [Horticoccus luteus]QYM78564.1 tetratricopeptide repeat protein [Horticoccus luteus]
MPARTLHRLPLIAALAVIVLAGLVAYRGSFAAPFVFDDLSAVRDNRSIRQLWPLSEPLALAPRTGGSGADGRPLVNLSLALNYAWSGLDVRGYRVTNLIAHILAALALFALVRRTLTLPKVGLPPADVTLAAAASALLWVVHPLQSESVLIVQNRSEILTALCYFLTLLFVARAALAPRGTRWSTLAIVTCLAGMACKETMVSAPLAALLYDRTFLAGSFRAAWRQRGRLYLALAATWGLLAVLVLQQDGRSGTAGFGLGVTAWNYLCTQCAAIVIYLKLVVWPSPLVLDYGLPIVRDWTAVWPQAALLVLLGAAAIWALRRCPRAGFLGFVFFATLAPSSSVIPIVTQTMAEHRMYLPLAPLLVLLVLGLRRLSRFWWAPVAAAVLGLTVLTAQRIPAYRSELALWTDTVAHAPENARAHNNLGNMLAASPADLPAAIAEFRRALQLQPDHLEALNNLGNALVLSGPAGVPEAIACYEHALRLDPNYASAHSNLGEALAKVPGRLDEAIAHLERAVALKPQFPEAQFNLALALAQRPGSALAAIAQFDLAIIQQPELAEAHYYRANLLLAQPGRVTDAIAGYEAALRLNPRYPEAHHNLGTALARTPGRLDDAIAHLRTAIELKPDYFSAFLNLGLIYAELPGHETLARTHLERALALRPDSTRTRAALGRLNAHRRP